MSGMALGHDEFVREAACEVNSPIALLRTFSLALNI